MNGVYMEPAETRRKRRRRLIEKVIGGDPSDVPGWYDYRGSTVEECLGIRRSMAQEETAGRSIYTALWVSVGPLLLGCKSYLLN